MKFGWQNDPEWLIFASGVLSTINSSYSFLDLVSRLAVGLISVPHRQYIDDLWGSQIREIQSSVHALVSCFNLFKFISSLKSRLSLEFIDSLYGICKWTSSTNTIVEFSTEFRLLMVITHITRLFGGNINHHYSVFSLGSLCIMFSGGRFVSRAIINYFALYRVWYT